MTGVAVWIAFKYINRNDESPWRRRLLAWLISLFPGLVRVVTRLTIVTVLVAWAKGSSSKGRAKIPDPESPKRETTSLRQK